MLPINRRQFVVQTGVGALGLGLLPWLSACKTETAYAVASPPSNALLRATPESQGVDSQGILNFLEAAATAGFEWHSFMLLRHGKVVAEGWWSPFKPEYYHTLYSLSKSFTSTAVGFAEAEGLLKVTDKVISFFPDQLPAEVSPNLAAMDIHNLLTMHTGHDSDSFAAIAQHPETAWVPQFFKHPVPNPPGTNFLYDTGATFMASAIVQKVTGMPVVEYLKPRLFDPLGIEHYDWEKSPEGINTGGFGLRVTTEAIAKFGQTYLNKGMWNGRQVVPEHWTQAATQRQVASNPGDGHWSNGYGYQFWRCIPQGVYRGDGRNGQLCIVMPEQDAVLALTAESWDMAKEMDIVFEHLFGAVKPEALPENTALQQTLAEKLQTLHIPVPTGSKISSKAGEISGKSYQLSENPFGVTGLRLSVDSNQCECIFTTAAGDTRLLAGMEKWITNGSDVKNLFPVPFFLDKPSVIAATATWKGENTLEIFQKMVETIHGDTLSFEFDGDQVALSFQSSLAAHETGERTQERRAKIVGKAAG